MDMARFGHLFEVSQVNGQKKVTSRIVTNMDGEDHEVFIGHLPRDLFEDELLPILQIVGQVVQLRIMMNFSGLTRGYAFAKYATAEAAKNAEIYLNKFPIRPNHEIAIVQSVNNRKLFIGRIPFSIEEETLRNQLITLTDKVVRIYFKLSETNGSWYRSCLVEYVSHTDACSARRVLIPNCQALFGSGVFIDWAETKKTPKSEDKHEKKKFSKNATNVAQFGRPIYGGHVLKGVIGEPIRDAEAKSCKTTPATPTKFMKHGYIPFHSLWTGIQSGLLLRNRSGQTF